MSLAGIESSNSASDRTQTLALDRSATGIGNHSPLGRQILACRLMQCVTVKYVENMICTSAIAVMRTIGSTHAT